MYINVYKINSNNSKNHTELIICTNKYAQIFSNHVHAQVCIYSQTLAYGIISKFVLWQLNSKQVLKVIVSDYFYYVFLHQT